MKSSKYLKIALWVLLIIAILGQWSKMVGYVDQMASRQSIVAATNNDAGRAIQVARKTRLWNDNGFRPYGNVYYRIVHVMQFFSPPKASLAKLTPDELDERNHHYFLMFVSLVSVILLAFLISWILFASWPVRLLGTLVMTTAIFGSYEHARWVLIAHPDHLFALCAAFATYLGAGALAFPNDQKKFKHFALAWGLATAVKATSVMFFPSLLAVIWMTSYKQSARRLWTFIKWSLASYMLVGFPQNINIGKPIKFLLWQRKTVQWGDSEFLAKWIELFKDQLMPALIALLIIGLLLPLRQALPRLNKGQQLRLALLALLPVLGILSRKILAPYHHYPLSFVAVILVIAALFLSQIFVDKKFYIRSWLPKRQKPLWQMAVLFAFVLWINPVPTRFSEALAELKTCQAEAATVEDFLKKVAAEGHFVLADPYIPFNDKIMEGKIKGHWRMSFQDIDKYRPQFLALKQSYYSRYIDPAEGGSYSPDTFPQGDDITPSTKFYSTFFRNEKVSDLQGNIWEKIYSDACSWEIWERR